MDIIKSQVILLTPINRMDILKKIEEVGRTCYKSEDRITETSAPRFVKMLVRKGHEAMIEHVSLSVKFITNRGVSHEIVRHRLASYAQESTRYVNYGKRQNGLTLIDISEGFNYNFDLPSDQKKYNEWWLAMKFAEESYLNLLRLGATPEEARSVLPNSLKTEIVMTANLREWRQFIKLRSSEKSHPEIRILAKKVRNEFAQELPEIFDDLLPK